MVVSRLTDENAGVRAAASIYLGMLAPSTAVSHLVAALDDDDSKVQANAAWALGRIGDPSVAGHLLNVVIRPGPGGGRLDAAVALAELGVDALQPLIDALESEHGETRTNAAVVIGYLGKKENELAQQALASAVEKERLDVVASAYSYYLREKGPRASRQTQRVLAKALMEHGDSRMASAFLNRAYPILESATHQWAEEHGYTVETRRVERRPFG